MLVHGAAAGRVQVKKVLNDYREHEMEQNLNDVSDILDELRHQVRNYRIGSCQGVATPRTKCSTELPKMAVEQIQNRQGR
jgi:hypothetical protein